MDYSPWVGKGNLAVFESTNISETKTDHAHQNWCACMWHQPLLTWFFWADSNRLNFLMTMDYSPWVDKGNLVVFESTNISETEKRLRPPKLVCMHVTSTPAYMIFLGRFQSIKFFDDHGLYIVHGSERENWPFLKVAISPKPERTTPTKIGVYVCYINSILAWFFWANSNRLNFLMTMDYSPWVEREIWPFLKVPISPKPRRPRPPKLVCMHLTTIPTCMNFLSRFQSIKFFHFYGLQVNFISETEKTTPTKIGVHALDINPYLHEFFEPIPID